MADSFSDLLGLRLQQTGGNDNTWGDLLNSDVFEVLENAIAGRAVYTTTGGTLDLSASPVVAQQVVISGALASDATVVFPNLTKRMLLVNGTTNNFSLLVKSGGGVATQIPRGTAKDIRCTGGSSIVRTDIEDVGEIRYFANPVVPFGFLECDGSAISRASYPDLFAAIATTWGAGNGATTFNLPDLKTAGRFIRAGNGGNPVGTYQNADLAAHAHTASASTSTSISLSIAGDGGWTPSISISDPGHRHQPDQGNAGATFSTFVGVNGGNTVGGGSTYSQTAFTNTVTTGISATSSGIGNHAHAGTSAGASSNTSVTINNSAGTETRPVNASALACVRY